MTRGWQPHRGTAVEAPLPSGGQAVAARDRQVLAIGRCTGQCASVPIVVVVKKENREQVRGFVDPAGGTFDAAGDFDGVLPEGDGSFPLLKYVDRYGDTIFNTAQMDDLLADIERLTALRLQPVERRGLERLRVMAERCRNEPHLYLWFVGD
jgi:hypothetical protein